MTRKMKWLFLIVAAVLLLSGCAMKTVDEMYCLPKRSEAYRDLQSVMDGAMAGMSYSAPISGDNQQTVQMADLDGDGEQEFLVFARAAAERPLRILVFDREDGVFTHTDTIESNGTAFEQVEYAQMDKHAGMEIVVGCQLSNQVMRSVSVYTFGKGSAEKLMSTNYSRFLTLDLDEEGLQELFVLRPGETDSDNGVVALYGMEGANMERSIEVNMSVPASGLKRMITGRLHGGRTAVFAAGAMDDTTLVTDVYTVLDGVLTNVSVSNESGTSVGTMRNHYIYADDIDNDGVVELPSLIPMEAARDGDRHELIRWYAMTPQGGEVDKLYTYHNFVDGWYLILDKELAKRVTVTQSGARCIFYVRSEKTGNTEQILEIEMLTGENREEQREGWFVLNKADSAVFTASLSPAADRCGITRETVMRGFCMIYTDWKTGET